MTTRIVLVTGGAGHVGSHLIEQLIEQRIDEPDTRIISLDNYHTGKEANHIPGAEYRRGHTRDIDRLVPETPDVVYHLGEYARIATSFEDVAMVYDFNIAGTFAVVEFCRTRAVGKLVYAASSTKFAIEGDGRHQNPYSFSKATNVDLINDYGRWFGLPYAICYFYNAFGPRETGEGKYATLIAKYENLYRRRQPLPVVAPGTQRRAFTYVGDLARGIRLVGERGSGDGYALRAPDTHTVADIAAAFGGPIEIVEGYAGREDVAGDPARARDELHWTPTVDVMDYIRAFKAHVSNG
jgi:UDP-glucose 4-epimerase